MSAARSIPVACFLSILILSAVADGGSAAAAGTESSVARRHIVSTNPILDLFTWYNAEYEFRLAPSSTIGMTGSYISIGDDDDYKSLNGFYRYFPQGVAPAGFFFGGRLGVYDVSDKTDGGKRESATFYGFGIDIGYAWLLGDSQRFALSLGIGAVRVFGGDLEDVAATLPTVRVVNVGIAF
jgi:hypothetical protein